LKHSAWSGAEWSRHNQHAEIGHGRFVSVLPLMRFADGAVPVHTPQSRAWSRRWARHAHCRAHRLPGGVALLDWGARPSVRPRAHRSGWRRGEAGQGGLKRGGNRWSGKRRRSDGVPARVQVRLRALPRLRSMTPPVAPLTPPNSRPVYCAISMGPPFQVSGTPPVPVFGRTRAPWASNRARTIARDLPAAWRGPDSFRAAWRSVRTRGSRSGIPAGQASTRSRFPCGVPVGT
jgi:hypothetical protein